MTTTATEICNIALKMVRSSPIGDINETTAQAEDCRILYPVARDEVLTIAPWGFNKAVVTPAVSIFEPAEWKYAYAYPAKCLSIRYLLPQESISENNYSRHDDRLIDYEREPIPYELLIDDNDLQVIGTNQYQAKIVYSRAVEDVRLYGTLVVNLIAARLAMSLATPRGGDAGSEYYKRAERQFTKLKSTAEASHLNQRQTRLKQQMPRSVAARLGYGIQRSRR